MDIHGADCRCVIHIDNMQRYLLEIVILISLISYLSSLKLSYQSRYDTTSGTKPHLRRLFSSRLRCKLPDENTSNQPSNVSSNPSNLPSIFTGLAGIGLLENSYLTWTKLTESDVSTLCLNGKSCEDVLASPYSSIPGLNIPLSSLGIVAYGLLLLLTQKALTVDVSNKIAKDSFLFLSTAMATFSGYLMTVLYFVIEKSCSYCYLNATIAFSIAILAWNTKLVSDQTKKMMITGSSAVMTTLFSTFLFYSSTPLLSNDAAYASTAPIAQLSEQDIERYARNVAPKVTKESSAEANTLAQRIKKLDGRMYGAYWCSHCFNQKQNLGKQAFEMIEYIECDKEGFNNKHSLCREKKVPGYPTWEIQGKLYPGEKEISELEALVTDIENGKI